MREQYESAQAVAECMYNAEQGSVIGEPGQRNLAFCDDELTWTLAEMPEGVIAVSSANGESFELGYIVPERDEGDLDFNLLLSRMALVVGMRAEE